MSNLDLEKRIEHQVMLGTWGRVHGLHVQLSGGHLTVRGRTPSHYIKQLVLQAVIDVLGHESPLPVDFDIQVGSEHSDRLPGSNDLWGVPRLR